MDPWRVLTLCVSIGTILSHLEEDHERTDVQSPHHSSHRSGCHARLNASELLITNITSANRTARNTTDSRCESRVARVESQTNLMMHARIRKHPYGLRKRLFSKLYQDHCRCKKADTTGPKR